jgi:hypothetical protein
MENRVYKTINGLTMVESSPYSWQRQSVYHGQEKPYFYSIHVGDFGGMQSCIYEEENNEMRITHASGDSPAVKFKVANLEEAGEIVEKLVAASGHSLEDTIYFYAPDKLDGYVEED